MTGIISIDRYAGQKFGKWTAIKYSYTKYYKSTKIDFYQCQCECGKIINVNLQSLKSGKSKGCRDCFTTGKLEIGSKYNRLTIIERFISEEQKTKDSLYYKCLCDCGEITIAEGSKIKLGHTKSCGCLHTEVMKKIMIGNKYRLTK